MSRALWSNNEWPLLPWSYRSLERGPTQSDATRRFINVRPKRISRTSADGSQHHERRQVIGSKKVNEREDISRNGNNPEQKSKERGDEADDPRNPMKKVEDGCKIAESLGNREAAHGERIRLKENLHVARRPPYPLLHGTLERFGHESGCQHLVEIA